MAEGGTNGPKIKTYSILDEYKVHWNQKLGTGISGPVRFYGPSTVFQSYEPVIMRHEHEAMEEPASEPGIEPRLSAPCVHKADSKRFALKCLPDNPKSRTEINLHLTCSGHPNVVQIFDIFANDLQFPGEKQPKPCLLMVMEMMEGGELFDRISREKRFTERKAAFYFKKIAEAVKHCHSLNVAHRDLKPENVLLADNSEEAEVKLSDFGFAKIDDGNLQTPYFTPYYVAPQVLEAHRHQSKLKRGLIQTSKPYTYDKSCDMWSLGVILYIMLCGYPPFYSETPSRQITLEMRRKILSGEFEFPEEEWCHVSQTAKDIVRSLLHVDPSYRLSIDDLIQSLWFEDAPDNQLHSPAVISDKQSLQDINLAHSQQLTMMRTPECQLTLKPLTDTQNPILRKRKYRENSETAAQLPQDTKSKRTSADMLVKSLRNIIAYCILPPKVDDDESVLNGLVNKTLQLIPHDQNGFSSILKTWNWDGDKFNTKVDKSKLSQLLSEHVQQITSSADKKHSNGELDYESTDV